MIFSTPRRDRRRAGNLVAFWFATVAAAALAASAPANGADPVHTRAEVTLQTTPSGTASPSRFGPRELTPVDSPAPTVDSPAPTVDSPAPTLGTSEPTASGTPRSTPMASGDVTRGAIRVVSVDNNGTIEDLEDDVLLDGPAFAVRRDDGDSIYEPREDALVVPSTASMDAELVTRPLDQASYWIIETRVPRRFIGSDPILIDLNIDGRQLCLWDFTGSLGCRANDLQEAPWTVVIVDNTPDPRHASPSAGVKDSTGVPGRPALTLPPTDAVATSTPVVSSGAAVALLAMIGVMGGSLILAFSRAPNGTTRDEEA